MTARHANHRTLGSSRVIWTLATVAFIAGTIPGARAGA